MRVEAIKCSVCGRLYEVTSNKFVTVYGNICLGVSGGMVGNNIDDNGKVAEPVAFCYPHCIANVMKMNLSTTR
jgi:hypothetical protein